MENNKCLLCQKPLVAIGNRRKNGKMNLNDWNSRKLHKKCVSTYEFIKDLTSRVSCAAVPSS